MDRRDFLKFAAALPAVAAIPQFVGEAPLTVSTLKAAIEAWHVSDSPWYYMVLHQSQEQALRDMAARERWRSAYQAWRKDGRPEMNGSAILEKYTPVHTWDVDVTNFGTYENFKFITTEKLPT